MNQEQFIEIVKLRHEQCITTLDSKGQIYATEDDRLSNFTGVAAMNATTPQKALWSMVSKHIVATRDMVKSGKMPPENWIKDYLGDIHAYMYLLEAIWKA